MYLDFSVTVLSTLCMKTNERKTAHHILSGSVEIKVNVLTICLVTVWTTQNNQNKNQ